MKNTTSKKTLRITLILIFGFINTNASSSQQIDFLDVEVGQKLKFEYRKLNRNDFRSKLPYHFFDVPLPSNSVIQPLTHFKVSINKKTSILHSKVAELPLTNKDCVTEEARYRNLFSAKGFKKIKSGSVAIPGAVKMLAKDNQILRIYCESSGNSPYLHLRIEITTEEEHRKYEEVMRNFHG